MDNLLAFMAPAPVLSIRARLKLDRTSSKIRPQRKASIPRAVLSPSQQNNYTELQPTIIFDKAGTVRDPLSKEAIKTAFSTFIKLMPGLWNSQRTYHYVTENGQKVEPSQTTFQVDCINVNEINNVLQRNHDDTKDLQQWQLDDTYGFSVSFRTKMQSSDELVVSSTNLAFVPNSFHSNGVIQGSYYRDLGYEESNPVKAEFTFDAPKVQLLMTTYYEKVVSNDSIQLVNPSTRLRQIVNYERPKDGGALSKVLLVGYGFETRGTEDERLVK